MLSELDQMETDWMGCMASKDPEAVAAAYRLLGHHRSGAGAGRPRLWSSARNDHRDDHRRLINKKADP